MWGRMIIKTMLAFSLVFAFIPTSFAATTNSIYYNQSVTAYVAPSGAKTYYGTTPRAYVTAAVHPKSCWNPYSGTIFPKGTIIHTTQPLYLPGYGQKSVFVVEDMGDVNCNRGLSTYWFDIYFGVNTSTNYQNAIQFGLQTASYYIE